jgi:hypothetical protein
MAENWIYMAQDRDQWKEVYCEYDYQPSGFIKDG